MDDMTMRADSSGSIQIAPGRLAALVGARMCHDLVSPLGAIGNGLELLQMSDEFRALSGKPELALIADSVEAARARVRWFRLAFGQASPEQRLALAELARLLVDAERGGRLRIRLEAEGDLTRVEARLIVLAVMCLETALPWGGSLLVCRGATGWRLVAEAPRTRPDPALWAWLDGSAQRQGSEPSAAEVHFPLLAGLAAQEGQTILWNLDDKGAEIAFRPAAPQT